MLVNLSWNFPPFESLVVYALQEKNATLLEQDYLYIVFPTPFTTGEPLQPVFHLLSAAHLLASKRHSPLTSQRRLRRIKEMIKYFIPIRCDLVIF